MSVIEETTTIGSNPRYIPGVKPLLGHHPLTRPLRRLQAYGMLLKQYRDEIATLEHRYATYGDFSSRFMRFEEGTWGQLFLFGPEYNKLVLSDSKLFQNTVVLDDFGEPDVKRLGYGLIVQNGDFHREQRRLVMPAFHRQTIQGYRDAMVEIINATLDTWVPGTTLDMDHAMHQLTMHIATRTLFGVALDDDSDAFGESVVAAISAFTNPFAHILPVNQPGFPRHRAIKHVRALMSNVRALIDAKRAQPDAQDDALAVLLHATGEDGGKLSDDELMGQVVTLFIAGHETSANALAFTLLLLSQHPDVAAKLDEELQSVLQGSAPTIAQLGDLPYLDAVIKESMRLFPPASIQNRVAHEPVTINGYDLPQYTMITISQYITHRMPDLYEQPRRFLPERWETIQPGPYEYLPFGAGPRLCIGAGFAMMEIKLVLALLLMRYRLELVPRSQLQRRLKLTLGFDTPLPMMISERDGHQSLPVPFKGRIREMVDWA